MADSVLFFTSLPVLLYMQFAQSSERHPAKPEGTFPVVAYSITRYYYIVLLVDSFSQGLKMRYVIRYMFVVIRKYR